MWEHMSIDSIVQKHVNKHKIVKQDQCLMLLQI